MSTPKPKAASRKGRSRACPVLAGAFEKLRDGGVLSSSRPEIHPAYQNDRFEDSYAFNRMRLLGKRS